jgi:hypothetical protein
MNEPLDKQIHPISPSSNELHRGPVQPVPPPESSFLPPPLDSLIKILDPTSMYHNYYAQVKYRYSSPKGVYFIKVFVESEEGCCSHLDRAMKLINYTYPTAEEAAAVATKFSIGKPTLVVVCLKLQLRLLRC